MSIVQSILMIVYKKEITKAVSMIEVAGGIGSSATPIIASLLNYIFGYKGPFIAVGMY